MTNSRLVYSTADGDRRKQNTPREPLPHGDSGGDGVVYVALATAARRGKIVTTVRGLPTRDLHAAASDLKRHCGAGGSLKEGTVEIQGNQSFRSPHGALKVRSGSSSSSPA